MNKPPHITTVFIFKTLITRGCWMEDKVALANMCVPACRHDDRTVERCRRSTYLTNTATFIQHVRLGLTRNVARTGYQVFH